MQTTGREIKHGGSQGAKKAGPEGLRRHPGFPETFDINGRKLVKALMILALLAGLLAVAVLAVKYLILALGLGVVFVMLLGLLASTTE